MRSRPPTPRPATSQRSASPTSARRPSYGTARRASRSTTRSSGRTRAPLSWCASSPARRGSNRLRDRVGLPLSTYFSGPKIAWILDHVAGRARARRERASSRSATSTRGCCGTSPAARDGGVHATDVTNASRTMLMDLQTLQWHEPSLELMGIPRAMLPEIRSSSEVYGEAAGTALGGSPDRRHPRRPAGRAVRADVLFGGRGQEHLRHGLLPAAQHRRADRALRHAADAASRRRSARRPRPTCSRARSR